jgi:hypothetical protein
VERSLCAEVESGFPRPLGAVRALEMSARPVITIGVKETMFFADGLITNMKDVGCRFIL